MPRYHHWFEGRLDIKWIADPLKLTTQFTYIHMYIHRSADDLCWLLSEHQLGACSGVQCKGLERQVFWEPMGLKDLLETSQFHMYMCC